MKESIDAETPYATYEGWGLWSQVTLVDLWIHLFSGFPSAPKVERLDDSSCEVTWEALPPMKGDPIIYTLQCMMGNSDFKQVLRLFDGSASV